MPRSSWSLAICLYMYQYRVCLSMYNLVFNFFMIASAADVVCRQSRWGTEACPCNANYHFWVLPRGRLTNPHFVCCRLLNGPQYRLCAVAL